MCHYLVETRFIFGARSGVRVDGKLSGEEDKQQMVTEKLGSVKVLRQ